MATLMIHITREEVRHLSNKKPFIHLRKCLVFSKGSLISLKDLPRPGLYETYTSVQLILERRFINQRLLLPVHVEKAIVWYMNHYPDVEFDDEQFAYRAANIQSVTSWKLKRTRRLRPGDHVFFMKETLIAQKAIYIGAKLCLMIWEQNEPLQVTGIHDIKQAVGATHLATWHPYE